MNEDPENSKQDPENSKVKRLRGPYKAEQDRAESILIIRVKRSDKARWIRQSRRAKGRKLSQWVIRALNREAARQEKVNL